MRGGDQTLRRFAPSLETFDRMRQTGLSTEIFSVGGTGTYNIMSRVAGVTDLQLGSYIFMDCQYLDIGGEANDAVFDDFVSSLTVVTTVLNTYFPNSLTTDAGAKSLTLNKPGPWVVGEPSFDYNASSDEFGVIRSCHIAIQW
jgi:D-serine deaminase-like pyridoxal phosphate-dependent protein